ncbi:MAG TPA: hypothetical protein ENF73_02075 [Proteobacteria bacterium]|nr:hypothetical protein [Pseudomonadota bacterium]
MRAQKSKVDAILTLVLTLSDEEIAEFINKLFPHLPERKRQDLVDVLISAKRLEEPKLSMEEVFGS